MSDAILLSKFHRSSPRVAGPYELLPLAERTADFFADSFYVANGVEQIYLEMLVTARTGTALVTPRLRAIMPGGALSIRGYAVQAGAVGSYVSGFGVGDDTDIDAKTDRVMITDAVYELRLNHVDAQAITYSIYAWVF